MKRLRLYVVAIWLVRAMLALLCVAPGAAFAQISTYSNTTVGNILDTVGGACTPVTQTISVSTSAIVGDVDIGVMLTHTYRSDLRVTIKSPVGTVVQLITNSGGSVDNLNVLFNDEAAAAITTHSVNNDTVNTISPTPPYQRTYQPQTTLSAFDGQNAQGIWTISVCDTVAVDAGVFYRSDLYITTAGTVLSDLSLTKAVNNTAPASGGAISYTLTATNALGSAAANGVVVTDLLPIGTSFVSATGTGTYNSGTGIWTVGTLSAGQSASLTINATVTATGATTVINTAEVTASSNADPDSFANNGSTSEDDYASVSFTVTGTRVAGTLPTLTCPVGSTVLDWDTVAWPAGSLTNSYAVANVGSVGFAVSAPGTFVNDVTTGGQSPALANLNTGGLSPAQLSLHEVLDFADINQVATTVITLPNAISGAQFRVFDVDYAAAQFADRLTVTGSLGGVTVLPTLTNGVANYVVGNIAIGDATSPNASANGNVGVTFLNAIDKITITYGSHTTAPANPTAQAIGIHDISFCNPLANLAISKTSVAFNNGVDPVFHTPLSDVIYSINVSNSGGGAISNNSFFIVDVLPSRITFFNGDFNGAAPGTDPVIFTDTNSGLSTFVYATDVRYAGAGAAPTSFAACPITAPAVGYDPAVRYICFNPKGTMAGKTPTVTPAFSISFRGRIN
jgi:uncharacterized repeat protein (TIGR01451 family)